MTGVQTCALPISAADTLKTDDQLQVVGGIVSLSSSISAAAMASAGTVAFGTYVTGDSVNRLNISADGGMTWGSGTAFDLTLARGAADTLQLATGDSFRPQSTGQTLGDNTHQWRVFNEVVATGSLPAAAAARDGTILIEDAAAGDRNLIIYAGGQRFRIDGGTNF